MYRDDRIQIEDWQMIDSQEALDAADRQSYECAVVLFKHSVTCGISAGAKHRLESSWLDFPEGSCFYYLDLLSHRSLSNAIADRYGVVHQSPQIIVLRAGRPVYTSSHHAIAMPALVDGIGLG